MKPFLICIALAFGILGSAYAQQSVTPNEREVGTLYVLGAKTAAQKWLCYLRDGTDNYEHFIGYVREEAQKGNLSLAEIGTSEKELGRLRKDLSI